MAATPEVPRPEAPKIRERKEEFIVPETLSQSGIKVVQKQFKPQVSDGQGQPIVQTPPAQVITVTPPADDTTLTTWSKGDTSSALTWFAAFWIRIIKKALHFGWKMMGKEVKS